MKTLQRSVTKLKIYPGFNKALLDTFKIKVTVMADQLKLCCVIFDELAIKDEVEEFGDVGKYKYLASRCVYVGFSM